MLYHQNSAAAFAGLERAKQTGRAAPMTITSNRI
jgi:hypothetical protein